MYFGEVDVINASASILAHSHKLPEKTFKKGRLLSSQDVAEMHAAGLKRVFVARIEDGELGENEAARILAVAACGIGVKISEPINGRCNLYATHRGLFTVNIEHLNTFNVASESQAIATLPPNTSVHKDQLVATVKIIPFAVSLKFVQDTAAHASAQGGLIHTHPYRLRRVGLIQTTMPGTQLEFLDKSFSLLNQHLSTVGSKLTVEFRCAHSANEVSDTISKMLAEKVEMILITSASAIVDRRDVVPAGVVQAGGHITRFGMPAEPGNLMLMGQLGTLPILGLPSCARSPKRNGFHLILERLAAGLPCSNEDITPMGIGGLLNSINEASVPLEQDAHASRAAKQGIVALVLAAGSSQRMGEQNKLLIDVDGRPIVKHVVDAALASTANEVIVVTGHDHLAVENALAEHNVRFVYNPDYMQGLSSSIIHGIEALPDDAKGILVCQADMPQLRHHHLDRIIAAFDPHEGLSICVPFYQGQKGNPVLWGKQFFPELLRLKGDVGARHLIGEHANVVCEVTMDDTAVLTDVDSPQDLEILFGVK